MNPTDKWITVGIVTWVTVGYFIWLFLCWKEGRPDPMENEPFSGVFVASFWPGILIFASCIGALMFLSWPFWALHTKLVREAVRRGQNRRKGGIENEAPGRIVELFGIQKE